MLCSVDEPCEKNGGLFKIQDNTSTSQKNMSQDEFVFLWGLGLGYIV